MRGLTITIIAFTLALSSRAAENGQRRVETEHLIIEWAEGESMRAVELAEVVGEKFYAEVAEMLGYEPPAKVTVLLNGDAERPDGSWGYPRVDSFARIHLYRYTSEDDSYFNALAHELVHVFRFGRANKDWFFEEGFAELVALRVDESLDGFPWFGFPVDLVAGQWLAGGAGIPLMKLQQDHRALNQPCKAQSYSLRSAFFDWLATTYGDDTVLEMASEERAGKLKDYKRFFGSGLGELEQAWETALLAQYEALENAQALTQQYRRSPIKYQRVCKSGKDF